MTDPIFRPTFLLICDDVRKEDNGKQIFIGCYEQDIIFAEVPATIILRPVVFGEAMALGEASIELAAYMEDEKIFGGVLMGSIAKKGRVSFAVPPIGIEFRKTGTFRFLVRIGEGEWQEMWNSQIQTSSAPALR